MGFNERVFVGVAYYLYHNLSVVVPWKLSEVGEKRSRGCRCNQFILRNTNAHILKGDAVEGFANNNSIVL